MPSSSFSAYDEDCSRCRRACSEKALSEPYSAFWNLIQLRIVEFVLLPGIFRSLCLAKTGSCSFRAGPRDVFLLNDTEVPEVNRLWRVHLSFPSAEAVVCTGAMKSSSSSEELQTNALVGWHVCVTEDVVPVKVNPGRSFYRSARSLSQKKSPQDPATPQRQTVLGWPFWAAIPGQPRLSSRRIIHRVGLPLSGNREAPFVRVTFPSFRLWILKTKDFCTVLRQRPRAVFCGSSLLTFLCFLKRGFQSLRRNVLWACFFFRFRRGFLSARISSSNRVMRRECTQLWFLS